MFILLIFFNTNCMAPQKKMYNWIKIGCIEVPLYIAVDSHIVLIIPRTRFVNRFFLFSDIFPVQTYTSPLHKRTIICSRSVQYFKVSGSQKNSISSEYPQWIILGICVNFTVTLKQYYTYIILNKWVNIYF